MGEVSATAENPNLWALPAEEPPAPRDHRMSSRRRRRLQWDARKRKTAFVFLLFFEAVYFARPSEWPHMPQAAPIAKVAGILAIGAFIIGLTTSQRFKLPKEMKLLVALFIQLAFTTLFSTWKGGSVAVVLDFAKIVMITMVLMQTVVLMSRLRQVLYLHTGLVALISLWSIYKRDTVGAGRLQGAVSGIYGNPNDLAATIICVMPFAVAFLLWDKHPVKKVLWGMASAVLGLTVFMTSSRAGFLGALVMLICGLIYMGKSTRRIISALLGIALLAAVAIGLQGGYGTRLRSIFDPDLDETGSSAARQDLLMRSIEIAGGGILFGPCDICHGYEPLVGVGPGQFQEFSGNWHLAHNTYTELAAEGGLLSAILFIWMLLHTMRKLRFIVKDAEADPEMRLFGGAILTALIAFSVMLIFLSFEYQFVTFLMIGYGSALGGIYGSLRGEASTEEPEAAEDESLEEAELAEEPGAAEEPRPASIPSFAPEHRQLPGAQFPDGTGRILTQL